MYDLPAGLGVLTIVDEFKPYVGANFLVDTKPRTVSIKLEKIVLSTGASWMVRQPFNLIFSTPLNVFLVEGLYDVKAEDGAKTWSIHISPIIHPPHQRLYQGIFN